jgi:hypothetical protein
MQKLTTAYKMAMCTITWYDVAQERKYGGIASTILAVSSWLAGRLQKKQLSSKSRRED